MEMLLFRWRRSEALASLRGFGLGLRLGRLLDFFSTFVFASHVCKCATKEGLEEGKKIVQSNNGTRHFVDYGADSGILKSLRGVAPGVCVQSPSERVFRLWLCRFTWIRLAIP